MKVQDTPLVIESGLDEVFNEALFFQYQQAEGKAGTQVKRTHFFNGRFENLYLEDVDAPNLPVLKRAARRQAEKILGKPVQKMGCWFNAMPPGAITTLHQHDDDDEKLSGVYYVRVPMRSGNLIVHIKNEDGKHQAKIITPQAGHWVFFSPSARHEVSENLSDEVRLSVAFNFA